jgi:hypothetical protein
MQGDLREQAKLAEKAHEWEKAAGLWRRLNCISDAEACEMIAEANARGDAYRYEVAKRLGPEPELTPTTVSVWKKWHEELREIYNKHFKKS